MTGSASAKVGLWRRATVLLGTAAVAGVSILAVGGGLHVIRQRAAAAAPPPQAPLTPVATAAVVPAAGYRVTRRFIGQVEAPAAVDVAFEIGGRIVDIGAREGDRVDKGTILARLDRAALDARRAALAAERQALAADEELAALTLRRSETLAAKGHRSEASLDDVRLGLARIRARAAAVEAQIAGADVELAKTEAAAPFDAMVGRRLLDPGQTVAPGIAVLRLFERRAPQLRVGLPPDLAETLAAGQRVAVEMDGSAIPARVLRLRPDLDPLTRTRDVVIALEAADAPAFGRTATLALEQEVAEPGFWAPLAALREGVRGSWTVLGVEAQDDAPRVRPWPVEVVHAKADQVYLRGAVPTGGRIVIHAPERVAPGQRVALMEANR